MLDSEFFLKIFLSLLIGGLIGAEREYKSKSAGFRTIIIVCLASTLFTMLSVEIGKPGNPDRIASNILTGLGFLGAGVIFREDNRITGITTATTIWISAALGMAIGSGHYQWAIATFILLMLVLLAFTYLQKFIDESNQIRTYKIVVPYRSHEISKYEHKLKEHKLRATRMKQSKNGPVLTSSWLVYGSKSNHESFVNATLKDIEVQEFEF